MDVAMTLPSLPGIGIMLGDGAGGLSQGYTLAITTPGPQGIAVTDLDNDGHVDLVTSSSSTNALVLSMGPVTFFDQTESAFFASTQLIGVQQGPGTVVATDINRDGWDDLVVPNAANGNGTLSVLLGTGGGRFAPQRISLVGNNNFPAWVALGDINGDQNQDAVVALHGSQAVALMTGDGGGNFTVSGSLQTVGQPNHVTLGDINGDGFLDIATDSDTNLANIYTGGGNGRFTPQPTVPCGSTGSVLVDGLTDFYLVGSDWGVLIRRP